MNERVNAILNFWFVETSPKERFVQNIIFDKKIKTIFFKDYKKAINNEYDYWQESAKGCLALIILLDQFSRNLFRNNPKAFQMDTKALKIATFATNQDYHKKLKKDQIIFIFLPFMHSEKLCHQNVCCKLITTHLKDHHSYKESIKFANIHKQIIKQFGRFPHRNNVLKRSSTFEEEKYLNSVKYDFFNI